MPLMEPILTRSAQRLTVDVERPGGPSQGKSLEWGSVLKPDICVIGAGSGGLSVAAAAAAFGVPVVLVEKGRMGGDCLNYGCVPSKALIAAARHADALRHGAGFGIADVEPEIDFRTGQPSTSAKSSRRSRPTTSAERFTALGVQVIKAEARFKDKRTVIAGDVEIRARRFVIATGSSPVVPPIPGPRQRSTSSPTRRSSSRPDGPAI